MRAGTLNPHAIRAFGAGMSLRKQQPKQGALLPIGLSSALTGGVDWPAFKRACGAGLSKEALAHYKMHCFP